MNRTIMSLTALSLCYGAVGHGKVGVGMNLEVFRIKLGQG